jgi:hypothetical protein
VLQLNAVLFILITILAIALLWHGVVASRKRLLHRFARRPDIIFDEFYSKFYATSNLEKNLVEELLNHVAAELDLPVLKLLPTDRFDAELAPDKGWDWDAGHGILSIELQQLAKKKGEIVNLKQIKTLDDYIRLAAKLW